MNKIKSPFIDREGKKDIIFQNKLREFFTNEKVEGALYFYGRPDGTTALNYTNLCKHDLYHLGERLLEISEEMEDDEI